ncbi:MAG TPA: tetratricopeptide repeat protein, partial [Saprospiraceae bacterium]|nr:tetratricopeptide repeat protein [Saprospiraceae bacterium]
MRHLPLLFLLCCNTAFAQNNGPEVLNLADTFYQKNDYAAALPCFLEAREFFNAAGNWEEAVRCLYKEADCFYELGQASESLKILEKQIPFYAQKGVEPFEIAKTY